MLPLAERAPNDDADVGVGNVQAFVQHTRGDERTQDAGTKSLEDGVAFFPADVAGDRHDQVLARNGVGRLVVGSKHRRTRVAMALQPLVEENPRRYQTERRQFRSRHGGDGDTRLPAPSRQGDDPAPSTELPGMQRGVLVRPNFDRGADVRLRTSRTDRVREGNRLSDQAGLDGGVAGGRSAIGPHSRIPWKPRRVCEIASWIRIAGEDRPAIEGETHDREAQQGACLCRWDPRSACTT